MEGVNQVQTVSYIQHDLIYEWSHKLFPLCFEPSVQFADFIFIWPR